MRGRCSVRQGLAVAIAVAAALAIPATAIAAYPGSNGRIVFAHDPSTNDQYDIFTMNPDGSGRVQLTNDPGNELRPSYSADGERILYAFRPVGTTSSQIWVMNADGSAQTPLTTPAPGKRQRADVLTRREPHRLRAPAECRRNEPGLRNGLRRLQRRAADGPGPRRRQFPGAAVLAPTEAGSSSFAKPAARAASRSGS